MKHLSKKATSKLILEKIKQLSRLEMQDEITDATAALVQAGISADLPLLVVVSVIVAATAKEMDRELHGNPEALRDMLYEVTGNALRIMAIYKKGAK